MALSAAGVSSSVRESSKPAARQSSALGANSQVCSGEYLEPKTSWLCAVLAPAVDSLTFGKRDSTPTLPAMIAWRLPPSRRNLSHAHQQETRPAGCAPYAYAYACPRPP